MAVRFLLGPAGSGKTHHCLSSLRDLERAGRPGIYLVPEQFTYSADRELLEPADLSGLRHVRVLSFTRIAWWLREQAGEPPLRTIDDAVRPMILRSVLERMDAAILGPLAPMRSRPGVLQPLSRFVGEVRNHGPLDFLDALREHGASPEHGASREHGASPEHGASRDNPERDGSLAADDSLPLRERRPERSDGGGAAPETATDIAPAILEKLRALAEVYSAYAARLREMDRRDPEEQLFGLEPLLDAVPDLDELVIYVDGFLSWTRRESELLAALATRGVRLEIALCCDPLEREDPRVPFRPVFRSMEQLQSKFARAGVELVEPLHFPGNHPTRFRSRELQLVEQRLYRLSAALDPMAAPEAEPLQSSLHTQVSVSAVTMQPTRDRRQEVIFWARQIDRWTRLDLDPVERQQIAVLVRDVEPYRDLVREIFARYEIPYFIDERRSVLAHPRVRLLLGALDVILGEWRRESVIAFLRNPLLGNPPALVDLLENLSLEFGRNYERWYEDAWVEFVHPPRARFHDAPEDLSLGLVDERKSEGEEEEESEEEPESGRSDEEHAQTGRMRLTEPMRRRILIPLAQLERRWRSEGWTGSRAVQELSALLRSLASAAWDAPFRNEIEEHPDFRSQKSRRDAPAAAVVHGGVADGRVSTGRVANRRVSNGSVANPSARVSDDWDRQVENELSKLLGELSEIWSDLPVSVEEFALTLREGLLALRLGVAPIRQDQVLIGDVQRSRVHGLRRVIVGGINDGVFPRAVSDDPVLGERDRSVLAQLGAPLGPSARERQEEEAYLFYIGLTRPSEQVVLTWTRLDPQGRETPPSPLLAELETAVPEAERASEVPADPDHLPLERLQTPRELGVKLLARLAELARTDTPSDLARMDTSAERARTDVPAELARTDPRAELARADTPAEIAQSDTQAEVARMDTGLFAPIDAPEEIDELFEAFDFRPGSSPSRASALAEARAEFDRGRAALRAPSSGVLPETLLDELYPGREIVSSVSRLQEFASCPYQSFAKSVLGLAPRPEARVTPLETGTLAHAALEKFFADPSDPREPAARLARIFEELAPLPEYQGFQLDDASRFRWGSTRRALDRFVEMELARLKDSPYRIYAREKSFGMSRRDEREPALELALPDGRALVLRGQIDRIDLREEGEQLHALVIDYKRSSRKGLPASLEAGVDLQLAAYLLYVREVEGWIPAGGLYVPVVPSPPQFEKVDRTSNNRLRIRAHGFVLEEEATAIDAGTGFLARSSRQLLSSETRLRELLETGRRYLVSYATTQARGWIEPRPLIRESRLPCDRCDFGAVCRYRPAKDPRRRAASEGMVAVEDMEDVVPSADIGPAPEETA